MNPQLFAHQSLIFAKVVFCISSRANVEILSHPPGTGVRFIDLLVSNAMSQPPGANLELAARRSLPIQWRPFKPMVLNLPRLRPSPEPGTLRKNPMTSPEQHDRMANAIRFLAMDAVEKANSGHPGLPMGMADVATVLFTKYLRFDPKKPHWPNRDRFVLSAGHGSMLLYSLLYLTGYPDMTVEDLKQFRQLGSKTAGHPEYGHATGIETTTGPLGQGLANSVGFALGGGILNAAFGNDLVNHYTYVLAGDGCLMEGVSQEAIALAGHLKLNRLIVFWD